MSEGIQAQTHDERVDARLAELQAERDAAVLALAKMREALVRGVNFAKYARFELEPKHERFEQFPCQQCADKRIADMEAALTDPAVTALAAEAREMRDPRVDPKPGDILRVGSRYGGSWYEVLPQDPSFSETDVSYICNGVETVVSLNDWRIWFRDAEVIRAARESEDAR